MIYFALVAVLAALQVADVWSTNRALRAGAREGNPLIAWLMARLGRAWWLGKAAMAAAFLVPLWIVGPQPATWVALAILIPAYGWVVRNNWRLG